MQEEGDTLDSSTKVLKWANIEQNPEHFISQTLFVYTVHGHL